MFMRRTAVGVAFSWALIMGGCANQATVVDLEDSTLKLKMVQRGLQRRIEALEEKPNTSPPLFKNQRSFTAELSAQIEELRKEVQDSTGRVSEAKHRMLALENRIDSESFRTTEILKRLDRLLEQMASIEQRGARGGGRAKKKIGKETSSFRRSAPKRRRSLSPNQAYNLAYNDYVNGNYDIAISAFDAFIEHYPGSILVPEALYWKGESYYGKGSYAQALDFFDKVIKEYPKSDQVSKSFLKAGFALLELQKPEEGNHYLRELLKRFPNSNEASLAKNKLAALR